MKLTHGLFLNIEKNRTKLENLAASSDKRIDAMLGLVAEFSKEPFVEGVNIVRPMRGVLHSGHIAAQENGFLTLQGHGLQSG